MAKNSSRLTSPVEFDHNSLLLNAWLRNWVDTMFTRLRITPDIKKQNIHQITNDSDDNFRFNFHH